MFKDRCELNGWNDNQPPPKAPEEGADPGSVESVACKRERFGTFCSAIAGNEELKNLVQDFQLPEEETTMDATFLLSSIQGMLGKAIAMYDVTVRVRSMKLLFCTHELCNQHISIG